MQIGNGGIDILNKLVQVTRLVGGGAVIHPGGPAPDHVCTAPCWYSMSDNTSPEYYGAMGIISRNSNNEN